MRPLSWRQAAAAIGLLGCAAVIGWRLPHGGAGRVTDTPARFLLAVAIVILVCHLLGAAARRLGQPRVVGEIAGGLLLGPSVLGALWPAGREWLLQPDVVSALGHVAELGLVTFMFLLGCELRLGQVGWGKRTVASTVAGAMGLPFLLGLAVAWLGRDLLGGTARPGVAAVFFGLALAITALPVLARILTDLGLAGTPVGTLALAAAAVGDGIAWAALTILLGLIGVGGAEDVMTTAALAVGLILATVWCVRPALRALVRWSEARDRAGGTVLPVLLAGMLGFAALTQLAGLHPAIGAFLFGLVVPRGAAAVEHIHRQLMGFTMIILLPLFFAGVGLQTALGTLGGSPATWLLAAAVLVVATAGKLAGCLVGARLGGMPARDGIRLGVLMNCRGVTELVVATIGLQYGLVSSLGFTLLVIVALVTTAASGPLASRLSRPPAPVATPERVAV